MAEIGDGWCEITPGGEGCAASGKAGGVGGLIARADGRGRFCSRRARGPVRRLKIKYRAAV